MARDITVYFQSNFSSPNLIIHSDHGHYDLTATFANIEKNFGSRTQCDEAEALHRRAQKELLKLECVRYAIAGAQEEDNERKAEYWLLPPFPSHREDCYTVFTEKEPE